MLFMHCVNLHRGCYKRPKQHLLIKKIVYCTYAFLVIMFVPSQLKIFKLLPDQKPD